MGLDVDAVMGVDGDGREIWRTDELKRRKLVEQRTRQTL
jgi:hypothetical protein